MPRILDHWTVMPHGPLEQIDDGILTVVGDIRMPFGRFPRRMTVVRLSDDRTAIWSAIALEEPEMARIEALGRPSFLIVPSDKHRVDAKIWKQRYPEIQVVAPPGAVTAVRDVVPVDHTATPWDDPAVDFAAVPGMNEGDSALTVRRGGGVTLVVNDIIGNVHRSSGLAAYLVARLTRFGGSRPRLPWPVTPKQKEDRAAMAAQFRQWAGEKDLRRILVSHGDPITDDPAGVLRTLAGELES